MSSTFNSDPSLISKDDLLDQMLSRLCQDTAGRATDAEPVDPGFSAIQEVPDGWIEVQQRRQQEESGVVEDKPFFPKAPNTFAESGLNAFMLETLILKYFSANPDAKIRKCAKHVSLAYGIVEGFVKKLKEQHKLEYVSTDLVNDYACRLTEGGRDATQKIKDECTYYGSAPVALRDYIVAVNRQAISKSKPDPTRLRAAFQDLCVNEETLERIGPAVNSGRGMFLYGAAGNGKTSLAERMSLAFGELIWIPRAVFVDEEVIRVYDPLLHDAVPIGPSEDFDANLVDHRWVRIKRPTVIVGGELRLESLDITLNRNTGVSEAPLQMKANGGVLVIDDFGRQKCSVDELLNRWIVPLEKRCDFLNTVAGKKLCIPFEQLVIFSTNLEPKDLVDEAFLRRIPYKIEILDPTRDEYLGIWNKILNAKGIPENPAMFERLMQFYQASGRSLRMCHARDLIAQIENYATYHRMAPTITERSLELAISNYFSVM
jgi:predicted ATPase with chaperone activity